MVKVTGKRKLFDEDADWVPAKGRIFTMKKPTTGAREVTSQVEKPKGEKDLSSALAGEPITDKTGLENAYSQGDTYAHGDTLYIAGTHNLQDVFDDVSKVPFWGDVRQAPRYQAAEKALEANPV